MGLGVQVVVVLHRALFLEMGLLIQEEGAVVHQVEVVVVVQV
jgi:hypothetical protein